jgi:hypothetical protein
MSRSGQNAKRLKHAVIRVENQPYRATSNRRMPRPGPGMFLAITTSSITARSGTTPGSGTVSPVDYDETSLSTDSDSVDVLNFSSGTAISSGKYCVVAALSGGNWIISVEC